jgi:hypothetical protein
MRPAEGRVALQQLEELVLAAVEEAGLAAAEGVGAAAAVPAAVAGSAVRPVGIHGAPRARKTKPVRA